MSFRNGFIWKVENKEVNFLDLKVGEAIIIYQDERHWYEGVVLEKGNTMIHNIPYIKIQSFGVSDGEIYPRRYKFYQHNINTIKRIAKIEDAKGRKSK